MTAEDREIARTELPPITVDELAAILVFGRLVPIEAQEDPEGFDGRATMDKIAYAAGLLNGKVGPALAAAQSRADAAEREAAWYREALREVAFLGLDCPAAAGPAAAGPADVGWYRGRAHACIGIAARALADVESKRADAATEGVQHGEAK